MHHQTIKLTLPLGALLITWGLFTSESFLQTYILLFFPITIWLSSLNIHFLHCASTDQFFLSLAQATRFFLFTSLKTLPPAACSLVHLIFSEQYLYVESMVLALINDGSYILKWSSPVLFYNPRKLSSVPVTE